MIYITIMQWLWLVSSFLARKDKPDTTRQNNVVQLSPFSSQGNSQGTHIFHRVWVGSVRG